MMSPEIPHNNRATLKNRTSGCFAQEQNLGSGLTGKRITSGTDVKVLRDMVKVVDSVFSGIEPDAACSIQEICCQLVRGKTIRYLDDPDSSDSGRFLEALGVFVYYRNEVPIGSGGVYRYRDTPSEYWLSRIGVIENSRGQGLGRAIVEHAVELIKQMRGNLLKAYTRDSADNSSAHRFYERMGFEKANEVIIDGGVKQRVYILKF